MPQVTQKSFRKAQKLIQRFQTDASKLPLEIGEILNHGAAIAFQRLRWLAQQTSLTRMPASRAKKGSPMKGPGTKKPDIYATHREKQLAQEAENRRKFLATLDPKVREFAAREFAKLGLHQ